MNIFFLHSSPQICAEMHVDRHVVKMIIEYAQLLSTAHRIIDGDEYTDLTANGRKIKRWRLPDNREYELMKASHINHPSGVWTRASDLNYLWLYKLWRHLLAEYTYRYEKVHSCARLENVLMKLPNNIPIGFFTEPTPAMPDDAKVYDEIATDRFEIDSLASYRNYYRKNKTHLAKWKKRPVPNWYLTI
jgi:hypothetical protein